MSEGYYYNNSRDKKRAAKRRKAYLYRGIFAVVCIAVIALLVFLFVKLFGSRGGDDPTTKAPVSSSTAAESQTQSKEDDTETEGSSEEESKTQSGQSDANVQQALEEAAFLAAQYDYDAAIEKIESIPGYEQISAATSALDEYQLTKASCVAVNPDTVPHIFYHSLIVDTKRVFDRNKYGSLVDGYNAWMVTIEEFNQVTQTLYDQGYVYVMLSDLYNKSTDSDGKVHYSRNTELMLPPGKEAIVLSLDDLAYYAQYPDGFAQKIVLDENNELKAEYVDANGNVLVGDYDWLPLLDKFIKEHPDASYKCAKGTIALTGYDGVFGYRTDEGFFSNPTSDEAAWIAKHPDVKLEDEIQKAKVIAKAIKEDGWEFASHSWGHRPMNEKSLDWLQTDTEKWLSRVEPIVGETDILIFPHGADIGGLSDYSMDNEKYAYLSKKGFHVFCNVDASAMYWSQFRDSYIRQARIDIDGYTLYTALTKSDTVISKLGIDANAIFDQARPTPVIANGAG
ncbi:MAG: polysaccharide deacetylase [Lachnospiraceae bacterium]|nr:polysaccharide deacetylase [Lachnospiraceae bacterium]